MATSMIGGRGYSGTRTGQTGNQMTGYGQMGGNVIPKGYSHGRIQQFDPQQMELFKQLFSQVSPDSQLGRLAGGDESQFEQIEAPSLRQLGQLQGGLASRFSGMGQGARRSSGFQQAQGSLASEFAEKLAANRMNIQQQALRDLFGMSRDLLNQNPYDQFLIQNAPKKKPAWHSLLGGALPVVGAVGGGLLGGPAGAAIGGSIGSAASQGFMGY